MQFGNYYQTVPVTSVPSHAKVYVNGVEMGRTPEFLSLRRGQKTEFHLVFPTGDEKTFEAERDYRWGTSFWGGFFLFIYGAPLGWGTDYWTGTAFDFKDIAVSTKSEGKPSSSLEAAVGRWLLPPPSSSSEYLSQDMARVLQKHLHDKFPRAKIIDYDSSELQFYEGHWRYDNEPGEADLNKLLAKFDANYFVESSVVEVKGDYRIQWELKDVYLKQSVLKGEYLVTAAELGPRAQRSFVERASRYFDFLPDIVSIDLGSTASTLAYDNYPSSDSKALPGHGFLGNAAEYIGAFSIGVATPANTKGGWQWSLTFVPSAQILARAESFPGLVDISDVRFERTRLSAGYGPRGGVNTRFGFFYLSLVPMVGWTDLKAIAPTQTVSSSDVALHLATEVGYSRFLSDRINIRLFVKTVSEDKTPWQRTITQIVGHSVSISDVNYTTYGVSFGYYFPIVKNWVHSL